MIRWYISPYSGTGTSFDAFHASAWDLIDPVKDKCEGTFCEARRHYIVRVIAPQAVHDEIISKGAGRPVSKLFQDEADEDRGLNESFSDEAKDADSDGYDLSWITPQTTRKDVLRHIIKTVKISQILNNHPRLFSLPLDSTAADLTLAQRTAIRNWMTSKGLDVSWITASTTLRELKHYIISTASFSRIFLAGKDL